MAEVPLCGRNDFAKVGGIKPLAVMCYLVNRKLWYFLHALLLHFYSSETAKYFSNRNDRHSRYSTSR